MQTVNKRQYIIYAGFVLGLLALCSLLWYSTSLTVKNDQVRELPDALDVAFDFYNAWLEETKTNGKVKPDNILLSQTILTSTVKDKLIADLNTGGASDPLLCQSATPDKLRMKYVHKLPTEVELMVMSKFATGTPSGYAVVTMEVVGQDWVITAINCSTGDVLEAREFSFDTKGQLLKNVPAPFDNTKWHLVFTENGTRGHVVPLLVTASSTCQIAGVTTTCDETTFKEAAYAEVKGTMTETGVAVHSLNWSEQAF
ncbi:MAG: hypothetical protein RLZZ360_54 [Candidatus Parcubacteria bacterium]|jgi:hypothetical protein